MKDETLAGVRHANVIREMMAGIEEEGVTARIVRFYDNLDLGVIGLRGAKLSGSGIGIGIQTRGTTLIHQEDLVPLSNLELFPQAPLIDLETFRAIGRTRLCTPKARRRNRSRSRTTRWHARPIRRSRRYGTSRRWGTKTKTKNRWKWKCPSSNHG